MAAITNLTFEQINDEATAPVFTYAAGDITLSLSALTGDTYTGLTDAQVVEAVWKLRQLAAAAQVTVNTGVVADEQLAAFPLASTGVFDPDTLSVPLAGVVRVQYTVDPNNIQGQFG
jgi:hypothetical protein